MKKLLLSFVALFGLVYAAMAADPIAAFSWDANAERPANTNEPLVSADGIFTISGQAATTTSARNKQGYTNSIKVRQVDIDLTSFNTGAGNSIGSIAFALQNGSSGSVIDVAASFFDGSSWIEVEKLSVAANADATFSPANLVSKAPVQKIRFAFPNQSWFLGVKVYANATPDGAPAFLSESPAAGSNLPSLGEIILKFDELVKAGAGSITLGNATVSGVAYKGNTAIVSYTSLTDATAPLAVPAGAITDLAGNALAAPVSLQYKIDITPPALQSITPTDGSTIHINDLGEDARKIKLTFDEPIKIDLAKTVTFGVSDIVAASVSGNVLTLSYKNLPYDATNLLTIPAGFVTDLSGNEWAGSTYTYNTGSRDNTAPTLTAKSVADNATIPIGGSISFTFNEVVVVKTQNATIGGVPVTLSNNGKVIGLNYTNLPYNNSGTVIIPNGAVTDTCGNAYTGVIFGYTTESKTLKAFDIVVPDDYATIQAAINSISDDSQRTLIYVKAGTYNEKLAVWKNNVSLIGENRDHVIISWNECSSTSTLQPAYSTGINSVGTDASYTMLIKGSNFYGENFTVRNDYNHAGGSEANKQAVAIEHITGDKHVLKNVKMFSFQDTYYPKSENIRQYLLNPHIIGGTDFIFGSGTCFIEGATIDCYEGGQYITAASNTQKEFGIVINNATVQYAGLTPIGTKREFNLGRPWKVPAKTAFLNSSFENGLITPAGWAEWSGTDNHLSADYGTYNNTNLNTSGFVAWSKQLTADEAARYNFDNAFNYGENNVWNPLPYCTAPEKVEVSRDGINISWTESPFAVGYLVYRNGLLVASTTETNYTDLSATQETRTYEVAAYNAYGATSPTSVSPTGIRNSQMKTGFLKNTLASAEIELQNPEAFSTMEIIAIGGQKVLTAKVNGAAINVSALPAGVYLAKGFAANGEVYLDKIVKK